MLPLLLFCFSVFPAFNSSAQPESLLLKKTLPFSHQPPRLNLPAGGTLQIIALRVEFQPDENRFTSGSGTFEPGSLPWLEEPGSVIDPLPHNREYFEAHLEFTKNYFEHVSAGHLNIRTHLLPQVIRLDHEMAHYSPIGEDPSNEPLANLTREAWQKLDEAGGIHFQNIDPETTAFVLFHAGVGRDIELTGTSLDPTPQDIPSLFLGQQALADLLDEPSFEGFPMNRGEFLIPHTILVPRTLSRKGTDVNGNPFVLPLSINGLLAAQIGSRLGLPDLFNTDTGRSGIGQFGLMDGAGIFAYNGLFPPEPSAWEKIYLGWQTSFEISPQRQNPVSLPAASLRAPESIARINLSKDEYFLIENRHRDPGSTGVTLTIQKPDGSVVTQTITNREIGETYISGGFDFEPDLEPGIVINASNFDWALPGGFDTGGEEGIERELNGGILIWHIDEAVIQNSIADNRINADPDHRGVELKEADGARDIGRPLDTGFAGGSNHPTGWAFDFWWKGNNASVTTQTGRITLYQNRFGPDTTPDNKSHSGSWSFFELADFSDNLPAASFNIRPAKDPHLEISLATDLLLDEPFHTPSDPPPLRRYPYGLQIYEQESRRFLIAPGANSVRALLLGESAEPAGSFPAGNYRQPLTASSLVLSRFISDEQDEITAWQWEEESKSFSRRWIQILSSQEPGQGAGQNPNRQWPGLISSSDGSTLLLDHTVQRIHLDDGTFASPLNRPAQSTASIRGHQAVLSGNRLDFQSAQFISPVGEAAPDNRAYASLLNYSDSQFGILLLGEDEMYLHNATTGENPKLLAESGFFDWPAIADLNRDGLPEFIYVDSRSGSLEAVNTNGAIVNNFPFLPGDGVYFSGTPLIADLSGSGEPEILITGVDGQSMNIYAFNLKGQPIAPFPLLVGPAGENTESFVTPLIDSQSLFAVGPEGDFKQWKFPFMEQDAAWPSKYGNHPYLKVSGIIKSGEDPVTDFGIL
ncbi:MAG: hypothetical protein WDZ36_01385, partial [Balneolaceae bacterium]